MRQHVGFLDFVGWLRMRPARLTTGGLREAFRAGANHEGDVFSVRLFQRLQRCCSQEGFN